MLTTSKPRRCSHCHERGHWRDTCPAMATLAAASAQPVPGPSADALISQELQKTAIRLAVERLESEVAERLALIRNLRAILVAVAFLLAGVERGVAQPIDMGTKQLAWTWAQGTGAPALGFRVKCGLVSGQYTVERQSIGVSITDMPLPWIIPAEATWFCVVVAWNSSGDSGPSNEVTFTGKWGGLRPASPHRPAITGVRPLSADRPTCEHPPL